MGYGSSKLEAEQLVQRSHDRGDVETVIVRAPWFYGPFQPARQTQWFAAVRKGRFPLVGPGRSSRSMAFTGNLVSGLLLAETATAAPGRAYWIADAEPYELAEILAQVRAALAAEGLEVSGGQPKLPALAGVVATELDRLLQSRGRYVQALHVLGELKDTIACDITRARVELGYDPQVEPVRRHAREHPLVPRARAADLMARTLLVTGGSGYFGTRPGRPGAGPRRPRAHLRPQPARRRRTADVDFVQGDVRDRAALRAACVGVDAVLHNVAQVPLARTASCSGR